MMRSRFQLAAALAVCLVGSAAMAQYTRSAGQNAPASVKVEEYADSAGKLQRREVQVKAQADRFGNAAGNQHDLAVDGAFDGQTVAVLHFYTGEGFDFSLPKKALAEKGFSRLPLDEPAAEPRGAGAEAEEGLPAVDHLRRRSSCSPRSTWRSSSASSRAARASTSGATTSRTTRTRTRWPRRCSARRCSAT